MIIKLSKDCRIVGEDGIQFTLQVRERVTDRAVGGRVSDRAGEMSGWKSKGYYGTLAAACHGVLKRVAITKKGECSVKDLVAHLDRVALRIEKACEGVVSARGAAELAGTVTAEELDALFEDEKVVA